MRRPVALAVVLLTLAVSASAKEYQSSFGFTVDIPDNWLALTKLAIEENPALAGAPGANVGTLDPKVLQDLKAKVENGDFEMFFDRATSDAAFADNINVRVGQGKIPGTPDETKAKCTAYAQALAKFAKRTLAVAPCETRTVGALPMFYVEYEGFVAGTVTMQYQVARPDGKLIFLTATCKRASLDKFRPDFEAIVKSIRFS
ncbi:MAG: hypothetical protein PHQ91_05965 [Thermoanaerobaculaceae bacterium]|nr:hypothetical protein [Thermoanaerobaculaceae bacterium]TAM51055.1 MAG: hypothetical protein EPN53_07080 [Acidobacteriota bacterium]